MPARSGFVPAVIANCLPGERVPAVGTEVADYGLLASLARRRLKADHNWWRSDRRLLLRLGLVGGRLHGQRRGLVTGWRRRRRRCGRCWPAWWPRTLVRRHRLQRQRWWICRRLRRPGWRRPRRLRLLQRLHRRQGRRRLRHVPSGYSKPGASAPAQDNQEEDAEGDQDQDRAADDSVRDVLVV